MSHATSRATSLGVQKRMMLRIPNPIVLWSFDVLSSAKECRKALAANSCAPTFRQELTGTELLLHCFSQSGTLRTLSGICKRMLSTQRCCRSAIIPVATILLRLAEYACTRIRVTHTLLQSELRFSPRWFFWVTVSPRVASWDTCYNSCSCYDRWLTVQTLTYALDGRMICTEERKRVCLILECCNGHAL